MPQEGPRDALEPLGLLDLARTTVTSQPLVLVLAKQLFDDALANGGRRRVVGEADLVAQNVREGRVTV